MLSNRLAKHFGAAAAAAVVVGSSNAAIVYSGVLNFSCAVDIDGTYINVETGQLTNGPGAGVPGWDVNPYRASTGSGMNFFSPTGGGMVSAVAATGPALNLASGALIGSTSNYSSSTASIAFGAAAGQWQYGADNLVGFRFVGADGQTRYGWMRFLMGSQPASGNLVARTVVDFAYESVAGASIGAGVVPAPGAIALLGLAGLAGRRRR
jgi:MYXO-CTERM domain-containing protein